MKYRVLYTTLLAVASLFAIGCDSTTDDEIIEPSQPVVTPSDSIPTEPTEPQPTEPQPTEPQPTEPQPTEPQPTEPQPTEPQPTEPQPTEPQPTEPQPTEPQPTIGTLLTESKINGVWTGSDGGKYYFYTTYNVYIENGDRVTAAVWSFTQSTKTLTIGATSYQATYTEDPETITLDETVVLTKTTESLPDESRYQGENKEIANSVGSMNSTTWVPEEVTPFE